jgi:hypothetical protein
MSYTAVLEDIEELPHYREFFCRHCGHKQNVYILTIQSECENCKTRSKLRRYTALGAEIEDVIDAVLAWIGEGDDLAQAMKRKKEIDSSPE